MKFLQILDHDFSLRTKIIILVSFILVLTTTDLIIKEIVSQKLKYQPEVTVIKNFWYSGYTENDDIGLSALRGVTRNLDKNIKFILMVCLQGLGSIVVIIYYFYLKKTKYIIPLAFIISGALGNLIDRIIRGYVVDYVIWYFKFIPINFFNPFPIFNLADTYTFCGVMILLCVIFFFSEEEKKLPEKQ